MAGRPQPPEKINGRPTLHGAYQRPTRSRRIRRARRRLVALLTEDFEPSTREQLLISTTADAMVRLNEANAFLDAQGGIVDAEGNALGVMKTYTGLINTIRRNLEALGLRPEQTEKTPDLGSYLRERSTGFRPGPVSRDTAPGDEPPAQPSGSAAIPTDEGSD